MDLASIEARQERVRDPLITRITSLQLTSSDLELFLEIDGTDCRITFSEILIPRSSPGTAQGAKRRRFVAPTALPSPKTQRTSGAKLQNLSFHSTHSCPLPLPSYRRRRISSRRQREDEDNDGAAQESTERYWAAHKNPRAGWTIASPGAGCSPEEEPGATLGRPPGGLGSHSRRGSPAEEERGGARSGAASKTSGWWLGLLADSIKRIPSARIEMRGPSTLRRVRRDHSSTGPSSVFCSGPNRR